jgi:hypothetical protein
VRRRRRLVRGALREQERAERVQRGGLGVGAGAYSHVPQSAQFARRVDHDRLVRVLGEQVVGDLREVPRRAFVGPAGGLAQRADLRAGGERLAVAAPQRED